MHKNPQDISRREFLDRAGQLSATATLPWIIPAAATASQTGTSPSNRITVGLIGHGVMGRGHLHRLVGDREVQVLAVCDVDRTRCEEARRRVEETYAARSPGGEYKGCTAYNDYRELLARPDLDAVVIVTPDHWHTLQSIHAVEAGKDVYCEKPISLTVGEGRRLVEAVRRYGRIFQTGTQYRSISTIRRVCEFVRAGGLGKVKSVFTLWGKLGHNLGVDSYAPLPFALPAEPVPDGLDWDLWVGPAPWQPYNKAYHRNPSPGVVPWAFSEDFGAAAVTWYHSHAADVIQYALGMENSGPVEFIYPGRGAYPTLTCRYANGTLLHLVDNWDMIKNVYQAVPVTARLAGNFGGVFVGERGWLTSLTTGGRIEGGPEELFAEMKLPTREVNAGDNDHHANWLECIRTRRPTSCGEEIGHRGASLGHLTIIAYKLQRSLKWDPAKEEFLGDEAANRLLRRSMRSPWHL
ncbi:MAG: Gfo/Idh/MocA family oxidoreductase [Planctomycetes bacterium]|jgi:hypothetical protein|nr:Gfo/Idh/MocA family oxidoreductase [Planctomycetota bacterium]